MDKVIRPNLEIAESLITPIQDDSAKLLAVAALMAGLARDERKDSQKALDMLFTAHCAICRIFELGHLELSGRARRLSKHQQAARGRHTKRQAGGAGGG